MTALFLPSEPNAYDHGTPLPAPSWLVDKTPGAKPLSAAFAAARENARAAAQGQRAAILAFREASRTDRDNNYVPLPSIEYDRWRQLNAERQDTETAFASASRAVKKAWLALRNHIAASEQAAEVAEATARDLLDKAAAAASAFEEAARAFAMAEKLVPASFVRPEGAFGYRLGTALSKLGSDAQTLLNPEKPWTFERRGMTK